MLDDDRAALLDFAFAPCRSTVPGNANDPFVVGDARFMKPTFSRLLLTAIAALAAWLVLSAASSSSGPARQPDKLVILSTTDVKGKTSPCG